MIPFYSRKSQTIEYEQSADEKTLSFLYDTFLGRFLLSACIARPYMSKIVSIYHKSPFSKKNILPFVKKHQIECDESELQNYKCFNDFFVRHQDICCTNTEPSVLIAPADSKLSIYHIDNELKLKIKNSVYDMDDIVDDGRLAERYKGGTCLVFRLCLHNYHRYHHIDNGVLVSCKHIKGKLHTIRPISEKYSVFSRNSRDVSILRTQNFGDVVWVDVGALLVGKIHNHNKLCFKRFEEKGYFEFGGSTIVLFLKDNIQFDADILNAQNQDLEISVCAGERIGKKIHKEENVVC